MLPRAPGSAPGGLPLPTPRRPLRRSWTYVRELPEMAGNESKIDADDAADGAADGAEG